MTRLISKSLPTISCLLNCSLQLIRRQIRLQMFSDPKVQFQTLLSLEEMQSTTMHIVLPNSLSLPCFASLFALLFTICMLVDHHINLTNLQDSTVETSLEVTVLVTLSILHLTALDLHMDLNSDKAHLDHIDLRVNLSDRPALLSDRPVRLLDPASLLDLASLLDQASPVHLLSDLKEMPLRKSGFHLLPGHQELLAVRPSVNGCGCYPDGPASQEWIMLSAELPLQCHWAARPVTSPREYLKPYLALAKACTFCSHVWKPRWDRNCKIASVLLVNHSNASLARSRHPLPSL
jgi:hypothetical protein